jgi:hypothetical protein
VARRSRYRYVDFAAATQAGFRNNIVTIDQVPSLVAQHGAVECYATIFRFADDILLYVAEHRVDGRPSIAGYDGRRFSPSTSTAIRRRAGWRRPWISRGRRIGCSRRGGRPSADCTRTFSGAKGFHLLIDTRAFGGVRPAESLHRVFGRIRLETLALLGAWNARQRVSLPAHELHAVVHSAYVRPHPYAYGCHDEVIRRCCPYATRLWECADYRAQHPRSGRAL